MSKISYDYFIDSVTWMDKTGNWFRKEGPCTIEDNGGVYFSQIKPCQFNRTTGPSEIFPDGKVLFTNKNSYLSRTDGPAYINKNGRKEYWVEGKELSTDEFFLKYGVL